MEVVRSVLGSSGFDGYIILQSSSAPEQYISQVARVSYGLDEVDRGGAESAGLIRRLLSMGHLSIFEHVSMSFKVRVPLFVGRQWLRHRIGSFNEKSLRHTEVGDKDFYVPGYLLSEDREFMLESSANAYDKYCTLLSRGVAKEVARMVLPCSVATEFYWTVNLRSMFNFLMLRADKCAQYEMVIYALAAMYLFSHAFPITFEGFLDCIYKKSLDLSFPVMRCSFSGDLPEEVLLFLRENGVVKGF